MNPSTERTLFICKPDTFNHSTYVMYQLLVQNQFKKVVHDSMQLTYEQAENFYSVHRGQPYFESNAKFISSGPIGIYVLEKENAILELRALLGSTDPTKAAPGTLRHEYAKTLPNKYGPGLPNNGFHASDSPENAAREIRFFFSGRVLGDRLD